MTEKEQKIIHMLESLYEEYSSLDTQHKDDMKEFINALHILQHLVMIRSVRRKYSDLFPIDKSNVKIINEDALGDLLSVEVKKYLNGEIQQ
jgi:hypothetical protein